MPNTPFPATAEGMPKFPNPKQVSLFMEITPALRQQMERTVEHLIWLLDTVDDDPDLEDDNTGEDAGDYELTGDDEPSLGWSIRMVQSESACGNSDDCELDESDDEPILGWCADENRGVVCGDSQDLELDKSDYEPWLGQGSPVLR